MNIDFQMILITLILTIYFILPAYFANGSALLFGGGKPVDFGKSDKNGVRWIGDGVTWKGLIAGTLIGTIIGAIQGLLGSSIITTFGQSIIIPIATNLQEGIIIGFLLGFGALLGDALGSFIKRRIGIGRGKPAPILDQLDFIIVALLLVSIVVKLNVLSVTLAIILTLIIHLITNTCAFLLGIKDVWY